LKSARGFDNALTSGRLIYRVDAGAHDAARRVVVAQAPRALDARREVLFEDLIAEQHESDAAECDAELLSVAGERRFQGDAGVAAEQAQFVRVASFRDVDEVQ